MEITIDAQGSVAGRVASAAAKALLKGGSVSIVNAEKAVVTGDPKYTLRIYKEKFDRGDPYMGPFYPRIPDMMLKRMVRGMLPYKKPMGARAFKRLRVYLSVPEELANREFLKLNPGPAGTKKITLEKLSGGLK